MNHQVVEYNGSSYIFPKCFAQKRGRKDICDKFILACLLFGVSCCLVSNHRFQFLLNSAAYSYSILGIMELLSRITSIREEYCHLKSRYKGSLLVLLQKIFTFNKITTHCSCFVIVIVAYNLFVIQENILRNIAANEIIPGLLAFMGIKFLTDLMELDESPVKYAKMIDRSKGQDYGSGMAANCFYGYLNFMLPPSGEDGKGLKENIMDFASRHKVTFASTKLFIFLPLSGKCPPNAADYSPNGILEQSEIVEPKKINKGGVRKRDYHNTVYKLHIDKSKPPVYVCCEFASALQTLHEVKEHNHDMSEFYREHHKELVINFYITLHKLIKDNHYTNMCELIFFQDKDENGQLLYEKRLDIGDLLLSRLNHPSIEC